MLHVLHWFHCHGKKVTRGKLERVCATTTVYALKSLQIKGRSLHYLKLNRKISSTKQYQNQVWTGMESKAVLYYKLFNYQNRPVFKLFKISLSHYLFVTGKYKCQNNMSIKVTTGSKYLLTAKMLFRTMLKISKLRRNGYAFERRIVDCRS